MGATDYLTGLGAMNYIDYDLFEAAGVRIHYMDYDLTAYSQLHGDFNPFVSAIDLLFNPTAPPHAKSCGRAVYTGKSGRWHAGRRLVAFPIHLATPMSSKFPTPEKFADQVAGKTCGSSARTASCAT